jgi:hypothetical protein
MLAVAACRPNFVDHSRETSSAVSREQQQKLSNELIAPSIVSEPEQLGSIPDTFSGKADSLSQEAIPKGFDASHNSSRLVFYGWSGSEQTHRWSQGYNCSIAFVLGDSGLDSTRITMRGWALGQQKLTLRLNGSEVWSGKATDSHQSIPVNLPAGTLRAGRNILAFELPDARSPGGNDPRILGFALHSLILE